MYKAASSIIIRNQDNRLFVARRALHKKLSPGEWELVGGGIEEGEQPEDTIRREIKEELNVAVDTLQYFRDYNEGKTAVFIITLKDEPKPTTEDFVEWDWLTKDEIKERTFVLDCQKRLLDYLEGKND